MKLGTNQNYLTALPISPKPSATSKDTQLTGLGEIAWASPLLAKALGGYSLGAIAGTAKVYPLLPLKASPFVTVQHSVQFLDDNGLPLDDMLKGIVEEAVKSKQLSAAGGSLFKFTLAGAEIVLEITRPSDKSLLEKMLSIGSHGIDLAEPLTDWVPHLAHAKPYLMAIVKIRDQLQAVVQYRASEAQALIPTAASALSRPSTSK